MNEDKDIQKFSERMKRGRIVKYNSLIFILLGKRD